MAQFHSFLWPSNMPLYICAFVLEVRSWSGHSVPVNLHQTKCYPIGYTPVQNVFGVKNKYYPPFWQERARSQGSSFPLWGLDSAKRWKLPRQASYPAWEHLSSTQARSSHSARLNYGGRSQLVAPPGPGPQTLSRWHHSASQAPRTQLGLWLLSTPKWRQVPWTVTDGESLEGGIRERFAAASRTEPDCPRPPDHPLAWDWRALGRRPWSACTALSAPGPLQGQLRGTSHRPRSKSPTVPTLPLLEYMFSRLYYKYYLTIAKADELLWTVWVENKSIYT